MREMTRLLFNKRFRTTFFMFIGFFFQFWWHGKTKRFRSKEGAERRAKTIYISQAKKFAATAVKMGGLIIKLGQFVSSRVDILPKEYTDTLAELQDSVAPVGSEIAMKCIEGELNGNIQEQFTFFDETPVAAASLGQVHKAVLKNGEPVAVKIMRPGIEETIALDLVTLKILIAFARRFTKVEKFVDLQDVYLEFEEVIHDELDYVKEANNIENFREQFAEFPGVEVPRVYQELSTNKLLVMEFIEGVKINEIDNLNINKKKLASILYLSFLKQLMEEGFFHADPHPGNLLVKQDGTLVYIDFGMVGTMTSEMRENMIKLAMAIYLKDAGGIAAALADLRFLRKNADKSLLTKNIKAVLSSFADGNFNIDKLSNEVFLEEMREFLYEQPFQIPSKTTFLGKAIATVYSLCNGLDKDFDIIALTKPFVEDLMTSNAVNPAKDTVIEQVKNTLLNILPSSRKVMNMIDQLESGEMRINPSKSFEKKLMEQQENQTRKLVMALFGTGLLISGAQLFSHSEVAGMVMMVVGGFITILQAGKGSGRRRRRPPHPRPPQFNK
ncbi:ABC1 kinase family protein [Bacillus sp. JJ1764]|uniref:ABC1 kinase family protein n=1 Tax=Bacillus sp. JJ1764 TaxID=3122964 RepID=UPI0030009730